MPIYVYACDGGHQFEDYVPTLEKRPEGPPCTEAGCGRPTRKIPSLASVKFKGAGWTPTHYTNRKENK